MATVAGVTNHWITAQEGFTTTLASTISSGATTVPLNSVSGYTNGDAVAFVIEPTDASKKQVFTGTIDTAGVQVTGVVWTEGTNQTHNAGVTVVDYWTATHQASAVKGLKVSHDQDGTLKSGAVDVTAVLADAIVTRPKLASTFATEVKQGWLTGDLPAVSSVTYNGNRSYDITFASTVASLLSPGMRLQTTRTVTAPTQCADLESGSSQYFAKANAGGFATGTTWTIKAKIKPESYANMVIWALDDGTNVIQMYLNSSGQIVISGGTSAAQDAVTSYQSVVLSKWQDVTGSITIGTPTGEIRIDDEVVPSFVTTSAATTVTISGDETAYIGRNSVGLYFDGKIAQVAVFNAIISDATLSTYSSQTMTGAETNCKGFWSLNNTLNDLNASANNLTASGGALATNADSPFANATGTPSGTTDVALVQAVSTTTATVQVPEGCTIPTSGNVASVAYSTTSNPYGWVADKGRWEVASIFKVNLIQSTPTAGTYYNISSTSGTSMGKCFTLPIGSWYDFGYDTTISSINATQVAAPQITFGTSSSTATDAEYTQRITAPVTGAGSLDGLARMKKSASVTTATDYYLLMQSVTASATQVNTGGSLKPTIITAIPAGI